MELETVWSGALETAAIKAQQSAPPPRHTEQFPQKPTTSFGRALVVTENREKVRAAFNGEWQTANQLAAVSGMTVQGVRRHLREALDDGIAEYKVVKSPRAWGRAERHFRRRQAAERAA